MTTRQNGQANTSFALRVLVGLAAFAVVLYAMHLLSGLIAALFVAYIITVVAAPLLNWLLGRGLPNWLAFVLTLAAILLVVLLLTLVFTTAVTSFTRALPLYTREMQGLEQSIASALEQLGLVLPIDGSILDFIEPGEMLRQLAILLGSVLGALSHIILIVLFVVFMLVQLFATPRLMRREIAAGRLYVQRLYDYAIDLRQYLVITTIIGLITGGLDTLLFLLLGIPNAVLWGLLAFILSFVPTIGFWLAAIPPIALALITQGPFVALLTLVGILLINGSADNIIKPKLLGQGLDLSPFMVIFSIVFWTLILGPAGAILGVPMTMLFKQLLLEPDEQMAWAARLMGAYHPQTKTPTGALPIQDEQDS